MIGIIYLLWGGISHIGYKVKELMHDSTATVDERTNTYTGFDGRLRDASTNKVVTWVKDENGDEVLWDRPGHVYRNISAEKRMKDYAIAKQNPNGSTVFNTKQRRKIYYKDERGNERYEYGTIFQNLETSAEYATRRIQVWYGGYKGENIEFYVRANNPYCLVRTTDEQKLIEKVKEKNGRYSWTKYPDDEKSFIKRFNDEPISLIGEKSSLFSFSR